MLRNAVYNANRALLRMYVTSLHAPWFAVNADNFPCRTACLVRRIREKLRFQTNALSRLKRRAAMIMGINLQT
jgi:hypothetical protein